MNPNLQFSAYGLYTVELQAVIPGILGAADGADTLAKTDYILVRDNTGIESINASQIFTVYPNPASDIIYFDEATLGTEIQTITIFNTSGAIVKTIKGHTTDHINIANLATGTYTIVLNDKKNNNFYSTFQKD
jgi:hypothetical protein